MPEASYIISNDASKELSLLLEANAFSDLFVLVDENTGAHCLPLIPFLQNQNIVEIQSGEENKTLETCSQIWQDMTNANLDRKAIMINLGGGVIGDMGGFCASTYKRGIRFINIPTTLLSQVDASVGGKLGIDFQGLKNHIGVFQEPLKVIIAPQFLETLSERELRSGFAEVIKHGLIADAEHFEEAARLQMNAEDISKMIADSVAIKERVVLQDPTEKGLRKILNFGHTIGHAIETYYLHSNEKLLHGEAIAIGMICEGWISAEFGNLNSEQLDRLTSVILNFFPKRQGAIKSQALNLMSQDKKNEDNRILCTVLDRIGHAEWDKEITLEQAEKALAFYNLL